MLIEIFVATMLVTAITGFSVANVPIQTPVPVVIATPAPQVKVVSEGPVVDYIREVFGEYSDKALYLLRGNEYCAENRQLDPYAVNDNRIWGGIGRDCGLFQINDTFHPYTCEQLKDYKLNTNYAWRMFQNDNYTFVRWSAGRCLGI